MTAIDLVDAIRRSALRGDRLAMERLLDVACKRPDSDCLAFRSSVELSWEALAAVESGEIQAQG